MALTFTGTVAFAPTFTDILLADFITDNVYNDEVSATGYPAATYSITEGDLPAGVTLNLTTGELTGTPTEVEAAVLLRDHRNQLRRLRLVGIQRHGEHRATCVDR